jgi:hypothetical protein
MKSTSLTYLLETLRADIAEVALKLKENAAEQAAMAYGSIEYRMANERRHELHGRSLALHTVAGRVEGMISIEEIYVDAPDGSPYTRNTVA